MAFKLSKNLADTLQDASNDLRNEVNELREDYESKSDRWKDSDTGTAVDGWLDTLEALADDLDRVDIEPE